VPYAHAKGVIHRDFEAGKLHGGAFGEVQVIDWGLAKVLAERDGQSTWKRFAAPVLLNLGRMRI
jgi:serine/threonine protein kinase